MDDPLNLMRVMPTQGVSEPDWPLSRALQRTALIFYQRNAIIRNPGTQDEFFWLFFFS